MNIDIKFPGENICLKMWDTLADKGMGKLLLPWQIKREGRAHAEVRRHEMLSLAQAEADIADLRAGRKRYLNGKLVVLDGPVSAVSDNLVSYDSGRIEPRLDLATLTRAGVENRELESARNEINASRAIIFAEEALQDHHGPVPDEAVDEDWLFTWYEYAGKVSNEDLQRLWGKVLAGEFRSPGSCSLRTLAFLRGLSKSEAELISKIAPFVLGSSIFKRPDKYLEERGLDFPVFLALQEIGVIAPGSMLSLTIMSLQADRFLNLLKAPRGKCLMLEHADVTKQLKIPCYPLSAIGQELMSLGAFEADIEFMRKLGESIAKDGYKVRLGDWERAPHNMVSLSNMQEVKAAE